MSETNYQKVFAWMEHVGQPVLRQPVSNIPLRWKLLRIDLMNEELNELIAAIHKNDLIEIADGIADLLYVVYGTAVAYGIDADAVFEEVHLSNMTKVEDRMADKRGKVIKGPNYRSPNVAKILFGGEG